MRRNSLPGPNVCKVWSLKRSSSSLLAAVSRTGQLQYWPLPRCSVPAKVKPECALICPQRVSKNWLLSGMACQLCSRSPSKGPVLSATAEAAVPLENSVTAGPAAIGRCRAGCLVMTMLLLGDVTLTIRSNRYVALAGRALRPYARGPFVPTPPRWHASIDLLMFCPGENEQHDGLGSPIIERMHRCVRGSDLIDFAIAERAALRPSEPNDLEPAANEVAAVLDSRSAEPAVRPPVDLGDRPRAARAAQNGTPLRGLRDVCGRGIVSARGTTRG